MESIKKRTYGQCVDCIEEKKSAKVAGIPIARLQADPLNSRCVPHQEKFESRRNY
jgi:RNA polymerase-binding transcription factor DksA